MKSLAILLILIVVFSHESLANKMLSTPKGAYLGQEPPGLLPKVFAPGIISTGGWEISGVFTPDMQEFYYIREVEVDKKLQQQFVVYKNTNNQWHKTIISPRVGQPTISPDGQTMYLGKRFKERTSGGWSEMKHLGPAFDKFRIMRLAASNKGTLVFDEATRDGNGLLRYSRLVNGHREEPKPLPKVINTGKWNAHPFIAPDESYIIWDGQRDSEVRNADLFVSFKNKDGTWGNAIKFGSDINTATSEGSPRVTPDGKYLFFRRKVGEFQWTSEDGNVATLSNTDIFWVDAKVIERLRPNI